MDIRLRNKKGIILQTAQKYCEEDIKITIDPQIIEKDYSVEDGLVNKTLTSYYNDRVTILGKYAFYYATELKTIECPNVTTLDTCALSRSAVQNVILPNVTSIGQQAFGQTTALKKLRFPKLQALGANALREVPYLEEIVFDDVRSFSVNSMLACYRVTKVVILYEGGVATLSNTSAFSQCYHILGTVHETYNPEGLADGFIYVPDSLVDSYKSATNWNTYASQIKGLSELPQEIKEELGI